MFERVKIFKNGFESFVNSLGTQTYKYGNATHAFADILLYLKNENNNPLRAQQNGSPNIIMPSFIPAKLYKTILAYNYSPRFYEIDKKCQFDSNEINELIDSGTKAIFVIHYFGYPSKIEVIKKLADEKNIVLIEDCAHVIYGREAGGRLGVWGDFSIFSPRKMLNLPEGGYLILNRKFENFTPSYTKRVNSLYTLSKLLQTRGKHFYLTLTNGSDIFSLSKIPQRGFIDYKRIKKSKIKNISRLSSFYSRVVDVGAHIEKRQQNYTCLYNGLKDLSFLKPLYNDFPVTWTPYSMPVIVKKGYRDHLQAELVKYGISCGAGWPESPFDKLMGKTSELAQNLIEFPVHPFIKINQLEIIIDVCGKFEKNILKESSYGENKSIQKLSGPENSIYFDGNHNNGFIEKANPETLQSDGNKENIFSNTNIKIKVVRENAELENLSAEWESLCEEADIHIFQTFEWQSLWWKYYGEGKQLSIILFYIDADSQKDKPQGGRLIGIAPFFVDTKYIGGIRILSRLRLIGSGVEKSKSKDSVSEYGVSDYLDLIIHRGYEKEISEVLAGHLKKNFSHYNIIQLDEVCTDSTIFKFLLPLLTGYDWKYNMSRREICPRIIIPETINEYFKQINPKVRCKLKKIQRDCGNQSLFKINKVQSEYELIKSFQDFIKLHQKRWNRLGLAGLFSDNKYKGFLKDVAHAFLKKGHLYFTTIYSSDECVAVECAFKYKNLYYDYIKAFDDQSPLARYRPGKALLLLLIEDAIENKLESVDLLRGGETYKFEFAADWQWIYKVTVNNPVKSYGFRYSFFLLIRFFVQIKRRTVNEFNIMATQIKNYGLPGITIRYIPSAIKKIKNKLYTPVASNAHSRNRTKKIITQNGNENNMRDDVSTIRAVSNSLSEIH